MGHDHLIVLNYAAATLVDKDPVLQAAFDKLWQTAMRLIDEGADPGLVSIMYASVGSFIIEEMTPRDARTS